MSASSTRVPGTIPVALAVSAHPGSWPNVGRAVWGVFALLSLGLTLVGVSPHYDELLESADRNDRVLQDLGMSHDFYASYISALGIATVVAHILIAAAIMWRRPQEWMAQFVAFALVANGTINPLSTVHDLAESSAAAQVGVDLAIYIGVVSSIVLLYLFPNGRFVPKWTLPAAVVWAALALPAVFVSGASLSFIQWPLPLLLLILAGAAATGVFAQIYRYANVSTPEQRQQAKWAVLGLMAAVVGPLAYFVPFGEIPSLGDAAVPNLAYQRLGSSIFTFSLLFRIGALTLLTSGLLLFPLSFTIAVLRYRLWDIGVVVNRTLVYAGVTGSLALIYFLSVVVLQALFRSVTGQENNLVIVVSTLAIAALFVHVRSRVQGLIDRRFYRRKYDAAQTLAAFSDAIRDEVDLERLSSALVVVVEETMQPMHASLWLVDSGRTERRGR